MRCKKNGLKASFTVPRWKLPRLSPHAVEGESMVKIDSNSQFPDAVNETAARPGELGMWADSKRLRTALSIGSALGKCFGDTRDVLRRIDCEKLPDEVAAKILLEIDLRWQSGLG